MKKRILSLLLALLMVVGMIPAPASATDSTEATVSETTTPAETTSAVCNTCGNEVCTCESTQISLDFSSDIEKFATINAEYPDDLFTALNATPAQGWADAPIWYYPSDFSADILFEIKDFIVVTDTYKAYDDENNAYEKTELTLWYQVNVIGGTAPEENADEGIVAFEDGFWILQQYLNEEDAGVYPDVLVLSNAEDHTWCDTCGKYDCGITHETTPTTPVCGTCGKEDCDSVHLLCLACGAMDCQQAHVFCGYCVAYDCGIDHTADIKPAVSAVIPENPTLTDGAAVSIVDEYGDPVTSEGFYLTDGTKASFSAWSDLEGASYQWQICYDVTNDLWADIQGQDEQGILVSAALFCSLEEPALRCVMSSGDEMKVSGSIPVILVNAPEVAGYTARTTSDSSSGDGTDQTQGETTTQYKLTIQYILSQNCKAAGRSVSIDYVGTFSSAEDIPENIPHPPVPGYEPIVDESSNVYTDGYKPDFTDGNPTDVTVTVYYDPAVVNYLVVHYVQGEDDNNYTEVLRQTESGITEQPVAENLQSPSVENVSFTGLHPLSYERPAIAADGSTVIEIYYDRIYYLISFDLGGGYGVDPVFDRYGAEMPEIETPTRAGYTFAGWTLDGTTKVDLPATISAENRKYTAMWSDPASTTVTVVYWRENADDYGFSVWGQETFSLTKDGEEIKAGMVLDGVDFPATSMLTSGVEELPYFTLNPTKTERAVEVLGNGSTVINVYYNRNVYTVYFYAEAIEVDGRTCSIPEHEHSDEIRTLICTEEHEHDPVDCFSGCRILICTEDHEHDIDDCYRYDCGMTVHTHKPDSVNCGTEKNPKYPKNTSDYPPLPLVYAITAKYDANISDVWLMPDLLSQLPTAYKIDGQAANSAGIYFYAWQVSSTGSATVSKRFTMNYGLCDDDGKVAYAIYAGTYILHLHYMVESFDRISDANKEAQTDTVRREYKGKYYDVIPEHTQTVVAKGIAFNHKSIPGLYFVEDAVSYEKIKGKEYNYFLYYDRYNFTLTFVNVAEKVVVSDVPYGMLLADYPVYTDEQGNVVPCKNYTNPAYPIGEEPGTLEFDGWYTTSNFYDGTQYLFDEDDTMPAGDFTVFAKWIPVTHTVTFHQTYEDMLSDTRLSEDTWPTKKVSHGYYLDRINDAVMDGYYFVNWFFIDAETGEEKAFDPENMPVTRDLKLYAKWTSSVTVEYTVRFCTKLTDGATVDIADPITNKSLAGQTITYDAKVGGALYPAYQKLYFPQYESQSLTLSKDGSNEIVFMYVQVQPVTYTVQYLNSETGTNVFGETTVDSKTVTTYEAAVTESYFPIAGYIPDESRKTLILTSSGAAGANVLTFLYTKTETEGPVRITHYTEDLNKTTDANGNEIISWSEYRSEEFIGTFGEAYSATPVEIPGFTYREDSTTSGTLKDHNGLYLDLYYTRNEYPYLIRYVEDGTYKVLASESGTAPYQSLLTGAAKTIEGYDCISDLSQTIEIKIEDGSNAVINVITFKYERKMSALKITKEVVATPVGTAPADDEFVFTVKLNGDGSDASATFPQPMYRYDIYNIGDDSTVVASGVVYPTASTSDSTAKDMFTVTLKAGQYVLLKGVPTGSYTITEADYSAKHYTTDNSVINVTLVEEQTTTAAFVNRYQKQTLDLTITTTCADADQSFIFVVSGTPYDTTTYGNSISLEVVLVGNDSQTIKDLPIGKYTVTEKNSGNWSWRETEIAVSGEFELKLQDNVEVTFAFGQAERPWWLSGCSSYVWRKEDEVTEEGGE